MKSLYILSDSTGVGQYVTLHKTWAHLLSEHLEGRYIVQNASRNGETTRQALERLYPDVLRYEPDLVYIQYGSNDANRWDTDRGMPRVTENEYHSNMVSFIRRCEEFKSKIIVGFGHTGVYNYLLKDVVELTGVKYVNNFQKRIREDGLLPDGVHLNCYGHRWYFENIAKAIP